MEVDCNEGAMDCHSTAESSGASGESGVKSYESLLEEGLIGQLYFLLTTYF